MILVWCEKCVWSFFYWGFCRTRILGYGKTVRESIFGSRSIVAPPIQSPYLTRHYVNGRAHLVLDVPELWIAVGADLPGTRRHLKWRARCLLVSACAYRPRVQVLRQLRAQEEIDDIYTSESSISIPDTPSPWWPLAPPWYDSSDDWNGQSD